MRFRARTAIRLLLVLIYFFDYSLRGENIVNIFLLLLLRGRGGVVAAVTEDDFYDFAQGLFKSSSRFARERNAGICCVCQQSRGRESRSLLRPQFSAHHKKKLLLEVIPRVCESTST
jgi:hypothetical protein